jgi:EEF1A lysine methyltransferase 4
MDQNLSKASFWDERYSSAPPGSDAPTHEWFKSFDSLKPFLEKHLFLPKPPDDDIRILHLGCGDSVSPPVSR